LDTLPIWRPFLYGVSNGVSEGYTIPVPTYFAVSIARDRLALLREEFTQFYPGKIIKKLPILFCF